jgi:hypothetical protein
LRRIATQLFIEIGIASVCVKKLPGTRMSNRSAKFAVALAASILAGANFTAVAQNAAKPADAGAADTKTADNCLAGPKGTAPAGSHWFYHLDRATKKHCWYLGDAKGKTAKAAAAQQQPPAADQTDASTADASPQQQAQPQQQPPLQPQPQAAMRQSIANAHAELTSPQATSAPASAADTAPPSAAASSSSAPADAQSPTVNARWFDAKTMAGANGTRQAAAQPTAVEQADATPQQADAAAPAAQAAVEAPTDKPSSSTQMLLIVMVGALALAGVVSALVFRLTRTRTPPYEIRDEWRAPWDSNRRDSPPPKPAYRERPVRLSEMPPRRSEPPMPRRESVRDPVQSEEDNRQIAEMLQRLARSAAN